MVNTAGRFINEKTAKTSSGSFVSLLGASTVYGSNHRAAASCGVGWQY